MSTIVFRKLTILLVFVFYSLASFGVSLNFFYCCGKLKSVSLKAHASETKDCPVQKGKNCCENKIVDAKVSIDQKANGAPVLAMVPPGTFFVTPPALFGNTPELPFATFLPRPPADPPEPGREDRSILFSVFRI
ncbi:hypothetical protein LL912_04525 [Niabella sp. CC-SYL272]|uniref:hypothetical protein n=1 Tax=Niabella agricola TaxID=2891571 RepID=UPI001F2E5175|nr:hypothetical protein [Niabella agricola]MCF3108037.1 hypothetical protein [Niabella agricola]